jgi:hypothetical protein
LCSNLTCYPTFSWRGWRRPRKPLRIAGTRGEIWKYLARNSSSWTATSLLGHNEAPICQIIPQQQCIKTKQKKINSINAFFQMTPCPEMTIEIYWESILIYDFYVINYTVTLVICFYLNFIDKWNIKPTSSETNPPIACKRHHLVKRLYYTRRYRGVTGRWLRVQYFDRYSSSLLWIWHMVVCTHILQTSSESSYYVNVPALFKFALAKFPYGCPSDVSSRIHDECNKNCTEISKCLRIVTCHAISMVVKKGFSGA